MNKIEEIKELLRNMKREELEELKGYILNGNLLLEIEKEIDLKVNAKCAVCEAPLGDNYYELRWKSFGLVKRARFDGLDCLAYFIGALRNKKEELRRQKNESR